ncbi:MAG: hypothetical protein JKY23_00315 [Nitrospinaceae bacterium]|nr:hypothetical protein [Nitrospinaceae bacterium]
MERSATEGQVGQGVDAVQSRWAQLVPLCEDTVLSAQSGVQCDKGWGYQAARRALAMVPEPTFLGPRVQHDGVGLAVFRTDGGTQLAHLHVGIVLRAETGVGRAD